MSSHSAQSVEQILGPDLILKIAEDLIASDPKSILSLRLASKNIHSLLSNYETSITKSVSRREKSLCFMALENSPEVLSTLIWPGTFEVNRFTYPWFVEIHSRKETIDYLLKSKLTDMSNYASNWPTPNLAKHELERRQQIFKKRALLLLYQLSDCAAKLCRCHEVRHCQTEFLESLPAEDLAAIGCIVEVIGHGYFSIMKNALALMEYKDSLLRIRPCTRPTELFIPKSVQNTADVDSDYWIRECMCVFEDRVQRYGPYFAWSFFEGHNINQRPDQWTREDLQEGIDDMNAFELGNTMSYASLQSVVWKFFCQKVECVRAESWDKAKRLVESEMINYSL